MLQGELRSVVIAVVVTAVIVPLLGRLLSRVFPPEVHFESDSDITRHKLRNRIIEYGGVVFFIAGISVPFLLQGADRLRPTATNIALILSFGSLFMVGGAIGLAALLGDRNAEGFLAYFERERRIGRAGVRILAKVMVVAAVTVLLVLLFLNARQ